ncbi:hypothetical protein BMF94_0454 [Rhodotorula taiwanensis]|uniref:RecQ-mediated genome instability protein 1 n=1 Tax=Rhodotorula taiwanensis TaxID=741276 RepID=A0A2S5BHK1_9BASI|nr:hypothetical protein BMF94_0454 [Rhodotorula taiwanensis]
MSSQIPEALHRWFRSAYPTLSFRPDWLQACVDYLLENEPSAKGSVPGLIKAVEVQLLSSDLATSVIPPSTLPTFDSKPDTRAKKQILFAPVPSTSAAGQAVKKKTGVLVQVVETDDVAHAALQLTDVLTEKREARKVAAKGGAANGGGGRIMDLDDQNEGDAAAEDLDAEAKRKALPAGVEPSYPRGSGKFVISDGGDVRWTAFELQRISGLGLEEMQLGTKLLLHDVPCINGILMLTPQNTTVKGYQVEELHLVKEWYLENTFRHRLGLDPLPDPREEDANDAAAGPAAPHDGAPAGGIRPDNRPRHAGKKEADLDDCFSDDDIDFDQVDDQGLDRRALPGRAASDEDEEEALREMMMQDENKPSQRSAPRPEAASRSGPAQSTGKSAPLQPKKERSTPQSALASSSTVRSSGNKVEVLDLDSADDDEPVRPARKKVKEEKTAAAPPRRPAKTVIEIDSD